MKHVLLLSVLLISFSTYGEEKYHCTYLSSNMQNRTDIRFELPENLKFGTLVPIKIAIRGKKNSDALMNTVVIKDKPFTVLSDLYRIKTPRASLAFLMLTPEKRELFLAYVNMGYTPSAEFFNGRCLTKEEEIN